MKRVSETSNMYLSGPLPLEQVGDHSVTFWEKLDLRRRSSPHGVQGDTMQSGLSDPNIPRCINRNTLRVIERALFSGAELAERCGRRPVLVKPLNAAVTHINDPH